jgi:alanine dehydrogenase
MAGFGIGISDEDYRNAGAQIAPDRANLYQKSEMIVKVKEPLPDDMAHLEERHLLFTYLHLAAVPEIGKKLLEKGLTAVAYETVQNEDRSLPLLLPMSEVAGRMSILLATNCLRSDAGGKGLLLSGIPGVQKGRVVILGGGVVGVNAAKMALGLGAKVTLLDINLKRLAYLDDIFHGQVMTIMSNQTNLEEAVSSTDVLIGAILIAGAAAPKLVSPKMVSGMENGSVIVDVAVDQGGCVETSRPTSISQPTYNVDGVIHCCISNIPATVARTSTYALTNVTFPFVKQLADLGVKKAMSRNSALAHGLNIQAGKCTHEEVAKALGVPFHAPPI